MQFTLIRFHSTGSTQDWARAWAEVGAPEGLAVQALAQTAGRGRLQRSWWSPPQGGLYISVVLRPDIPLTLSSHLTMMAALAAVDACQATAGLLPQPKWPNDLLLDGRKLAGILAELDHKEGRLSYAIIGLGLNVAMRFDAQPFAGMATSLAEHCPHPPHIDDLRDAYLSALAARYRDFLAGESPFAAWRQRLAPLGQRVRVRQQGQPDLVGVALDVQPEGALLVQDDAGHRHPIWAGDVIVEPQTGVD